MKRREEGNSSGWKWKTESTRTNGRWQQVRENWSTSVCIEIYKGLGIDTGSYLWRCRSSLGRAEEDWTNTCLGNNQTLRSPSLPFADKGCIFLSPQKTEGFLLGEIVAEKHLTQEQQAQPRARWRCTGKIEGRVPKETSKIAAPQFPLPTRQPDISFSKGRSENSPLKPLTTPRWKTLR